MNEAQPETWLDQLCMALPQGAVLERECFRDQPSLAVNAAQLISVMRLLRDQGGFRYLCDITALDWYPKKTRFQVVYHLWNHAQRRLLRVKAMAPGDPPTVPSVTALWTTANWHERECYDFFGVEFRGHPDLKRILTPDGWQGHPLRKDYPTMGPPEVQDWVAPRVDPVTDLDESGEGAAT